MFGALNPWLLIAIGSAALACFTGGVVTGIRYSDGRHASDEVLIMQASQAAQEAVAEQIAKIKVTHTTIQRKVEREVLEKPVYRNCSHDDSGLRLINAALTGQADGAANLKLSGQLGRAER